MGAPKKTPATQQTIARTDVIPHMESRPMNPPIHPLAQAEKKASKMMKTVKKGKIKRMPKIGIGDPSGQPQK